MNVNCQSLKDEFDNLFLNIKEGVSSLTFGKELLAGAVSFLSNLQPLPTSVEQLMDISHNTESDEPGTIQVFKVEVLFEDNKLVVKEMVCISLSMPSHYQGFIYKNENLKIFSLMCQSYWPSFHRI